MMTTRVSIDIARPRAEVWRAITDIEGTPDRIRDVETIEILEQPETGLVGLKWVETRSIEGELASGTLWISDAVDQESLTMLTTGHHTVYESTFSLRDQGDDTVLTIELGSTALNLSAALWVWAMSLLYARTTRKELLCDLEDIQAAVEQA